ncbi:unnamed protein product [Rotaria magnacalcarata]|uniref:BEN domain-containing protein n=1 Tax=Rotaria magnacalcarata TaxID=392030 RepID=A0A820J2F0_9BILA|nr:unnamed protein product [Rotaria magnacalcarata]
MPKKKIGRIEIPMSKRSKTSIDTGIELDYLFAINVWRLCLVVESQSLESSVEMENSSKNTNVSAVNLRDENEIQLVTAVEGSEKEKAVLPEVRNDFSSGDTALYETQGLFSSLANDGNTNENNPNPCDDSNGQKRFLDTNIAQPQYPTTVKHFTNTSNTLRGTQEDIIVDKDSLMLKMKQLLGLDEKQLVEYHEKTSKATARCLIKFLYPNPEPNFTYSNVEKSVINSIISYTKLSNPYDTASVAEIRKSINNYFTSLPRKTKTKTVPVTNPVSEESKKNDSVVLN